MHWGRSGRVPVSPTMHQLSSPQPYCTLLKILQYISEKIDDLKGPSNEISIATQNILLLVLNPVQLGADTDPNPLFVIHVDRHFFLAVAAQSTYITVPQCLSPRLNWDPPPEPKGGETHSPTGEGVPIRTTGEKA
jgi:hypothetical protein